jgi:hypothetical protein
MRGSYEDEPVAGAAAALAATDDDALIAAGMTADTVMLLRSGGPATVPLTDAVRLAVLLGRSLEWLLGAGAHPGSPPRGDRVDGGKVRALRKRQGLSEDDLRRVAGMALAPFRRAVRGDGPISLGQVAILAAHLGCEVSDLIAAS